MDDVRVGRGVDDERGLVVEGRRAAGDADLDLAVARVDVLITRYPLEGDVARDDLGVDRESDRTAVDKRVEHPDVRGGPAEGAAAVAGREQDRNEDQRERGPNGGQRSRQVREVHAGRALEGRQAGLGTGCMRDGCGKEIDNCVEEAPERRNDTTMALRAAMARTR